MTRLIAIDGPGGSGKSTLAAALAIRWSDTTVVAGDDFYRVMPEWERARLGPREGYERYFDWQRLRDQVLEPLSTGRAAGYQRYDWGTGQLAAWVAVEPRGVIVIEGVYTARPELRDYYDLVVVVDADRETCLRRMRARSNSEEWIIRWRAAEDYYLETVRPSASAELVIRGG